MEPIKINLGEIDDSFRLEEILRQMLESEREASLPLDVIERRYDIPHDESAGIEPKCQALARAVGASARVDGEIAVFCKKPTSRCVAVEYVYRRKLPGSKRWHVQQRRDEKPADMVAGETEVDDDAGDVVRITIAVPCDENGEINGRARAEHEDIADDTFRRARPGHEPA